MYTLAVEIHGLRQLERLQPEVMADIRHRVQGVVEVYGGSFAAQHRALWVFRFERARPDDRSGVLDALTHTVALLAGREDELLGWDMLLDYLDAPAADVTAMIRDTLLVVYEDNSVWLTPAACALLVRFLQLEQIDAGSRRLYRMRGRLGSVSGEIGSASELAQFPEAVDAVLDAMGIDDLVGGMLLLLSDDPLALRVNARAALAELVGSSSAVRWLEAEYREGDPLGPLVSAFTALDIHETRFWLNEPEKVAWDERATVVEAAVRRSPGPTLADARGIDLVLALETYLAAYVRRAAASVVPPVLLCHGIDRWPTESLDGLARIVRRLAGTGGEPGLIVVGTSTGALPAGAIASMVRHTVRLPRRGVGELRQSVSDPVNWERLFRLTRRRSAAVVHYLAHAGHWDSLPGEQVEEVTDDDLAWQVVSNEDPGLQEVLLAALCTAHWVSYDHFVDIVTRVGIERTRVPAILSRLRFLGLTDDRPEVVPFFASHREPLESHLGARAATLVTDVAAALLGLVDDEQVALSEEMVRFLAKLDGGRHVPGLFHRLLTRVLSERRFDDARRLLYDLVLPHGPDAASRTAMADVVAANRLRLALLQGDVQAAERARTASDRAARAASDRAAGSMTDRAGHQEPSPSAAIPAIRRAARCASADLAVQKARLAFRGGLLSETFSLLKHAILDYQDLDDQAGLARANLDFGVVLFAQEELLDAREYFGLAAKAAADGGDTFEQVRAQSLLLVSDFVYGNLTQALLKADRLDALAARLGMREMQLFAELVRGRAVFELGRYDEATDLFCRGRSRAKLYGLSIPGSVMERWVARSLIHDGKITRGTTVLQDGAGHPESALFLAEGLFRAGDYRRAIECLGQGLAASSRAPTPVEGTPWTSGFASLEDRAIGAIVGARVLDHQMMALRGYLLAESGRVPEGVQEMHRLTRELGVSDADPHSRIYYYLYSLILPDSGEYSVEDGSTVLGRAVRYFQQRTSRMEKYTDKTDYMRRNYWNARLMEHAQAHNLV